MQKTALFHRLDGLNHICTISYSQQSHTRPLSTAIPNECSTPLTDGDCGETLFFLFSFLFLRFLGVFGL